MSYVLHLGHQPSDISGINGLIDTTPLGFDPALDVNCIRFAGTRVFGAPFAFAVPEPLGDLWLGFRYVTPNSDANSINSFTASFLEIYDGAGLMLAQVKPSSATSRYHAIAHGDGMVEGPSSYTAPSGQPQWIDLRVAVGAEITCEFWVDGVLHSAATAPNTAAKGKPRTIVFANTALHAISATRVWYYAHIAALDGVSTIGRRFVRRSPAALASFDEMAGSLDALNDGDIATRVASTTAGQRMSFSLTGPTGPAAVSAIAGVHLKQIAQAGTGGPTATAGFLRIGGVNHDAGAVTVPSVAPTPVYSSWALNPVGAAAWTSATLPSEVGIVSA